MAKKAGTTTNFSDSQLLTAEDIFSGGDDVYKPLEIPELKKDGKNGIVYLKRLSAGDVLDFVESDESNRKTKMLTLIAKSVVHQDGTAMFTDEQIERIRDIRIDVFTRLSKAVNAGIDTVFKGDDDEGKADGAVSGDLPIV